LQEAQIGAGGLSPLTLTTDVKPYSLTHSIICCP